MRDVQVLLAVFETSQKMIDPANVYREQASVVHESIVGYTEATFQESDAFRHSMLNADFWPWQLTLALQGELNAVFKRAAATGVKVRSVHADMHNRNPRPRTDIARLLNGHTLCGTHSARCRAAPLVPEVTYPDCR
jgi:hypothetical protein